MTAPNKSILIIDPDRETTSKLFDSLTIEGYYVTAVSTGRDAVRSILRTVDLILLNPQLPDMNGMVFLRSLRQPHNPFIPVIILSNNGKEAEEIVSLEIGADDYLVKPVHVLSLVARIHALFRRLDQQSILAAGETDIITVADLSIFIPQFTVMCGEESFYFSRKEFEILVYLAKNRGKVATRQMLFHALWGHHDTTASRIIDVHIGRIRKKLKQYANYIETVAGVGYRFHA